MGFIMMLELMPIPELNKFKFFKPKFGEITRFFFLSYWGLVSVLLMAEVNKKIKFQITINNMYVDCVHCAYGE